MEIARVQIIYIESVSWETWRRVRANRRTGKKLKPSTTNICILGVNTQTVKTHMGIQFYARRSRGRGLGAPASSSRMAIMCWSSTSGQATEKYAGNGASRKALESRATDVPGIPRSAKPAKRQESTYPQKTSLLLSL